MICRSRWAAVTLLVVMCITTGVAQDDRSDRIHALIVECDRLSQPGIRLFNEALVHCRDADRLAASGDDARLRALTRFKLGWLLFLLERPRDAAQVATQAIQLASDAGALDIKGNAKRTLGSAYISLGQFDDAELALKEAAVLSSQYGTDEETAGAFNNLAVNGIYQGRLGDALVNARQALSIIDRALAKGAVIGPRMQFAAPFNVGKALADSGNYDDSRPYLERAFSTSERFGDIGGQMHVLFDTGEWYEAQGDLVRAERYYRRTVEFNRTHPSSDGEGKGWRGLGRVALAEARFQEAVQYLERATQLFEAGQQQFFLAATLVELARARALTGDAASASRALDRAIAMARQQNHRIALVSALIERGDHHRRERRFAEALADFDAAVERAERDGLLPLVPGGWAGRAAVAEANGDLESSLEAYEHAARALERIRGRIVTIELRGRFAATTRETFAGMVRVLTALDSAHPGRGFDRRAFAVLERERSQSLDLAVIEAAALRPRTSRPSTELRIAQIQNALFAPGLPDTNREPLLRALDDAERDLALTQVSRLHLSGSADQDAPQQISTLQEALQPGDAVIEYSNTSAFVATSSQLLMVPLDLPADLEARGDFFVRALEANARDASIDSGRALAAALIEPLLPALENSTRLLVVASSAVAHIPFSALPLVHGGGVTPLLTRFEVAYLPSLTIFQARRAGAVALERRVLAIGDAHSADERARSFARLPASRAEVNFVASVMPANRVMLSSDASELSVKQAANDGYPVLHLATHTVLDSRIPDRSAVLLGASGDEDGLLQQREIYLLPLKGSLIVLSGCRTAEGNATGADGLRGLARAFLQAGGRTVIGSLWDMPDRSTAQMVHMFYSGLNTGQAAGASLRSAQLSVAGDDPYRSSRAWAAMVVLGDPMTTLEAPPDRRLEWLAGLVVLLMAGWLAVNGRRAASFTSR